MPSLASIEDTAHPGSNLGKSRMASPEDHRQAPPLISVENMPPTTTPEKQAERTAGTETEPGLSENKRPLAK